MTNKTEEAARYISDNYIKAYTNETLDELSLELWLESYNCVYNKALVNVPEALSMAKALIEDRLGFVPDENY